MESPGGAIDQHIKVEDKDASFVAKRALLLSLPPAAAGSALQNSICISDEEPSIGPYTTEMRSRPKFATGGAIGSGRATTSSSEGCFQASGSPVTYQGPQVPPDDGRTRRSTARSPLPVAGGGGRGDMSESPTVENSPTRYQQFRTDESDGSVTAAGGAVTAFKQALGRGGLFHAAFEAEKKEQIPVQVVTTREEFQSEHPATKAVDPSRPVGDGDDDCAGCRAERDGRPGPVDAEDNQYTVKALLDKHGRRYQVHWQGYCVEHCTWELEDDIDSALVESFKEKQRNERGERKRRKRGRKGKGARGRTRRGVRKEGYWMKRTGNEVRLADLTKPSVKWSPV